MGSSVPDSLYLFADLTDVTLPDLEFQILEQDIQFWHKYMVPVLLKPYV